jgi:DNA-binding NtrC family response regulator
MTETSSPQTPRGGQSLPLASEKEARLPLITEPLIVAFEVGRYSNRLSFHLQQACFSTSQGDLASEAMILLRREQCSLLPVEAQSQMHQVITSRVEKLLADFSTESHFQGLEQKDSEIEQGYCFDPTGARQSLLVPVFDMLRAIREPLWASLDPLSQRALRFGEVIDQGLCPAEVYQYMGDETFCQQSRAPAQRLHHKFGTVRPRQSGPLEQARSLAYLVATVYCPGERPPYDGWFDDVERQWCELGLPFPSLGAAVDAERNEDANTPEGRRAFVEDLVRAAHQGLKSLAAAQSILPMPSTPATAFTSGPGVPSQPAGSQPESDDLARTSQQLLSIQRIAELSAVKKRIDSREKYIGESLPLLEVFKQIEEFNNNANNPVLILGPSGAGKTEIAELIHRSSERKGKPFHSEQATDNAGADMKLLKGRWVGYGKHSGIHDIPQGGQPGLLQECAGGTIFVDELAEVPWDFQTFLLKVLDRKPIPLTQGKGEPITPDVRLIFATNMEPSHAIRAGKLRGDLHRRIKTRTVGIPPLTARKTDIFRFIKVWCPGHPPSWKFRLATLRYGWPGNVGELRAVLTLAVNKVHKKDEPLTLEHLNSEPGWSPILAELRDMSEEQAEREVCATIVQLLEQEGYTKGQGLQRQAAVLLDKSESTVSRQLERLRPR